MGHCICGLGSRHASSYHHIRLRPFPRRVTVSGNISILFRGKIVRTGHRGSTGKEEAAGLVCGAAG